MQISVVNSTTVLTVPQATEIVTLSVGEQRRPEPVVFFYEKQRSVEQSNSSQLILSIDSGMGLMASPQDRRVTPRYDRRNWAMRRLVGNHPSLTDRILRLTTIFWTIVLSKALQSGLAVEGAIDVEENVEETSSRVVLRVYVDASAEQALAFWDGLAVDMDRWLEHLDSVDQRMVMKDIGLRVHWRRT